MLKIRRTKASCGKQEVGGKDRRYMRQQEQESKDLDVVKLQLGDDNEMSLDYC